MKSKTHGVRDMFNFWVREQRKKKPYLKFKYPQRNKNSELWYQVKAEINYLKQEVLDLDKEIQVLEAEDLASTNQFAFTSTTKKLFEKKKEIYDTKQRIKELEKESPEEEKLLMDFYTFRDVVYSYNKKAADELIQGEVLNMGERLGYLYILKVNSPSKLIDWKSSNDFKQELINQGEQPRDKQHPEGVNWLQYYHTKFYLRWAWRKRKGVCRVKNHTVYGFYPTGNSSKGVKGTKALLKEANDANPVLHERYITRHDL